MVGVWVGATGETKNGANYHGLRRGEKLGASEWGGESCEECVCGQKRGVENLPITGREKLRSVHTLKPPAAPSLNGQEHLPETLGWAAVPSPDH